MSDSFIRRDTETVEEVKELRDSMKKLGLAVYIHVQMKENTGAWHPVEKFSSDYDYVTFLDPRGNERTTHPDRVVFRVSGRDVAHGEPRFAGDLIGNA